MCSCWSFCKNRVVQKGMQYPLQLFRTLKKGVLLEKRSLCTSTDLVTPQGKVYSPPFNSCNCLNYSLSIFSQTFKFFHFLSPRLLYQPDIFSHARDSLSLNFFSFIPSSVISSRFISFSSVSFPFISSLFPLPPLYFHCRKILPLYFRRIVDVRSTDLVEIPIINRADSSE